MFSKTALAKMIDHSLLRPDASEHEITHFCEEAKEHHFACVLLLPWWVPLGHKLLGDSDVKVGTVVAFPFGALPTACKVFEARHAVASGAIELDIVCNIGAVKSGDWGAVQCDLEEVVTLAQMAGFTEDGLDVQTKIIIEVGLTTREEQERLCRIAQEVRADFIKTCTGLGPRGVTVADIRHIRQCVGREMGIKAAGGIRTVEQAMALINAGANRIGTSTGIAIVAAYDETHRALTEEVFP